MGAISDKLMESTKNLDKPDVAVELLRGAKKDLARIAGIDSKVFATRAAALALEVEHGKVSKGKLLERILELANEVKLKNM